MRKTKAETLIFIQKYIKKLKIKNLIIPNLIYFSQKNFKANPDLIFQKIKNEFKNKKIIIRSSAWDEDQINLSNAGKYKNIKLKKIIKLINVY